MQHLDLTDEETAALTQEVHKIVENDRYPFSHRIRTLRAARNKLRPEPVREPLPPTRVYAPAASRPIKKGPGIAAALGRQQCSCLFLRGCPCPGRTRRTGAGMRDDGRRSGAETRKVSGVPLRRPLRGKGDRPLHNRPSLLAMILTPQPSQYGELTEARKLPA
jgi:hypothetical protein